MIPDGLKEYSDIIDLPNERGDRTHVFRRTLVFGVARMLDK
jgi:hypothetical protein